MRMDGPGTDRRRPPADTPGSGSARPDATPAAPPRRRHELFLGEGVPEAGGTENLLVNVGPSHPAMHGIVRILAELDGEVIIEAVTGARLTISYGRVGGLKADLPPEFEGQMRRAFQETRTVLAESHKLLTGNRIFVDRMRGVGALGKDEAIAWAVTGPLLRAAGVPFDVRRATPYWVYDRLDFEIPVGEAGDNYDRYLVRMEEMEQSMRIAEQAFTALPGGPVNVDHEGRPFTPPAEYVDRGKLGKTGGLLLTDIRLSPNLRGQERPFHA